jgi:hypothetical protein
MIDSVVEQLFEELGCTEALTRAYIEIVLSDIATFDRKQHDYGPENIAAFGEKGVVVRMNDKMARLRNLVWGDKPASNEAVEDSYADLSVYGVIARMCRTGVWPGGPVETAETPWFDASVPTMPGFGTQTIWTDHALRSTPEAPMPPYDACSPLHKHEPDRWEDTPPEHYWCPVCMGARMYFWREDGAHCDSCGKLLFGHGLGGARNC